MSLDWSAEDLREVTRRAYRNAVREALDRGDDHAAQSLQEGLRWLEDKWRDEEAA